MRRAILSICSNVNEALQRPSCQSIHKIDCAIDMEPKLLLINARSIALIHFTCKVEYEINRAVSEERKHLHSISQIQRCYFCAGVHKRGQPIKWVSGQQNETFGLI